MFRKADSWLLLPKDVREQLYALLPEPMEGDPPYDPDIHPLKTPCKQYIEEELRLWQQDLKDGRETRKWRTEAMQASKDRIDGKFDRFIELQRDEYWGPREVSSDEEEGITKEAAGEVKQEANGDEERSSEAEVGDSEDGRAS
jgi:hypothetical protein